MPIKKLKRRNPLATVALLRKGGVHEKSRSAARQADKRTLKKSVEKYTSGHDDDRYFFVSYFYILSSV